MRAFLTAEWRYLLMLNYAAEPELLRPYLPQGVELDSWNGITFLSVVGFRFLHTRVMGLWMPWHGDFEEVNLRFYVRRNTPEGWRRGVVFIKEIVPRRLIAIVARLCYNEPYFAMPMHHRIEIGAPGSQDLGSVQYGWRFHRHWDFLRANILGAPSPVKTGSQEEFITEHYWGYTRQRNGACKEYQVDHLPWNVWPAQHPVFRCDVGTLYGAKFVEPLAAPPLSAFVAEGSPVVVGTGRPVTSTGD